jgi:hypothetical protein
MAAGNNFNHFSGLCHLLQHVQFLCSVCWLAILLFQDVHRFMGQFQTEERTTTTERILLEVKNKLR